MSWLPVLPQPPRTFKSLTNVKFFMKPSSVKRTPTENAGGGAIPSALFSQFGKVNYGYKDFLLADFTLRRDGSSRFSAENRYGVFPAFSVGVRLTELGFMKNLDRKSVV